MAISQGENIRTLTQMTVVSLMFQRIVLLSNSSVLVCRLPSAFHGCHLQHGFHTVERPRKNLGTFFRGPRGDVSLECHHRLALAPVVHSESIQVSREGGPEPV